MISTLANIIAYSKAPKATYAAKHPIRAIEAKRAKKELKHAVKRVGMGVGAAALAVPLGLWLGQKVRGR